MPLDVIGVIAQIIGALTVIGTLVYLSMQVKESARVEIRPGP